MRSSQNRPVDRKKGQQTSFSQRLSSCCIEVPSDRCLTETLPQRTAVDPEQKWLVTPEIWSTYLR